jgi:hypothetical protein
VIVPSRRSDLPCAAGEDFCDSSNAFLFKSAAARKLSYRRNR